MFKHALSFVLGFLNIKEFAKDNSGKSVISDSQREQLTEEYGKPFVEKFEADLKKHEANGSDPLTDRLSEKLGNIETLVAEQKKQMETLQAENQKLHGDIEKLSQEPAPEPSAEVVNENGKKVMKFKPNMRLAHNKVAKQYLDGNHQVLAAGETIDVDSVITEFDDLVNYVKLPMVRDIFIGFELAQHLTWKRAITSWKATKAIITSVIQQFVPKWTPLGDTTFTPLEIPLRRFKINVPITPAEVEDWILGMYDEGKDLDQHPVTMYIINQLIKPQAMEDLEDISATGEFTELDWTTVTEGDTGQDPSKSIDGFITQLKAQKALGAGSKMNHIALEALNSTNIITEVNKFVDAIDKKYKRKTMPVFTDPDLYRMYKRSYKDKYGDNSADPNFGQDVIDYSKNRLVPLYNMTATGVLFTTPPENFIGLRHTNEPGATKLTIRKYDYDAHVIGEFRFGIGFAIAEAVFYHIPDTDSGSGSGSAGGGV